MTMLSTLKALIFALILNFEPKRELLYYHEKSSKRFKHLEDSTKNSLS